MEITKQLAHVIRDENLFVRSVNHTEVPDQYVSEFTVDGTHSYLYENPAIANHVSGTSFLDTTRQLLKAVSHLFYDVPVASRFVIRTVNMDFGRWAKTNVPIRAIADVKSRAANVSGHRCLTFTGQVRYFQEGRQIGAATGQFMAIPLEIEELLMGRQYAEPPLVAPAPSSDLHESGRGVR